MKVISPLDGGGQEVILTLIQGGCNFILRPTLLILEPPLQIIIAQSLTAKNNKDFKCSQWPFGFVSNSLFTPRESFAPKNQHKFSLSVNQNRINLDDITIAQSVKVVN